MFVSPSPAKEILPFPAPLENCQGSLRKQRWGSAKGMPPREQAAGEGWEKGLPGLPGRHSECDAMTPIAASKGGSRDAGTAAELVPTARAHLAPAACRG